MTVEYTIKLGLDIQSCNNKYLNVYVYYTNHMTYNNLQMNDKFIIIYFIIVIAYKTQQPAKSNNNNIKYIKLCSNKQFA